MAEPRVLVIGNSFYRRLRLSLCRDCYHFSVDFKLSPCAFIKWRGVGGRTVCKTLQLDFNVSFRPEIVMMQLGSNDLTDSDPLHVGSAIDDFVRLLHDTYGVKVVCVCQTIMRQGAVVFNRKAKLLTKYLRVVLEPIPYAIFWGHRGFWRPTQNFYARDGVHLNSPGQVKYHRSLRGAILRSLSLFSTISSCWSFNVSFHFPVEPFKVYVLASPCLCFSDSRLCYWLAAFI